MNAYKIIPLFIILTTSAAHPAAHSTAHHATCPSWSEAVEKPPLMLGLGEQRLARTGRIARFSAGGAAIRATIPSDGSSLLIKGAAPGQTDLWVWKTDCTVERRTVIVAKNSQQETSPALVTALSRLDEAEIITSGAGVIIRGSISSMNEAARVKAIARAFPSGVRDETAMTPALVDSGHAKISGWLRSSRNAGRIRAERVGGSLLVRGALGEPHERSAVEKKILSIFPPADVVLESMPDGSPTVHFQVFLLEIKKSIFNSFGLSWPASIEGAISVSAKGVSQGLALSAGIEALEGEGLARILSRPELVVKAPGEAELFAGGEIPIKVKTKNTTTVVWRAYGLTLKLKILQAAGVRVRLEIGTEVSHLDLATAVEDIPGIKSNKMRTIVDASFGSPLLLSGLLQEDTREQARGLPLLKRLPVLGALFGSEDYLSERSELVAILLPLDRPPRTDTSAFKPRFAPAGPMPPPRNWIDPETERELRNSPEYPWNALR